VTGALNRWGELSGGRGKIRKSLGRDSRVESTYMGRALSVGRGKRGRLEGGLNIPVGIRRYALKKRSLKFSRFNDGNPQKN